MRPYLIFGAFACVVSLSAPAGAEKRSWYMGLEGGVEFDGGGSSFGSGDDSGWAGLVTVGNAITSHLSLEGELGYRTTADDYWGGDVDQITFMLNAVYEAPLSNEVTLTLGAGLGGNNVTYDYYWGYSTSGTKAAAQVKLGVSVAVSDSADLVANYRYMETWDSNADNSTVTVGIRFAL